MIEVQGPDGSIAQFPEGTPSETIKSAMAKRFGAPRGKGIGRKVDAAVRGAADFLSFGLADEAEAALEAAPAIARGPRAYGETYRDRLEGQRQRDAADKREVPVSRASGEVAGFGAGLGVGAVSGVGRSVPRLAPNAGRLLHGAETVGRNILAGAGYGAVAGAGGADPGLENRLAGARGGALAGAAVGAAAPALASLGGSAIRSAENILASPATKAVRRLGRAAEADVPAMRARAAEFRTAGIEPTLIDATDEAGRGVVRAAATRMTPGRQTARDFSERRALNLPDRIGSQARRTMSADPRTPDQITAEITARRNAAADAQFGAVRGEPVAPTDEMVQALRTPHAREAIAEAVRRERDPDVRAALSRLSQSALDDPAAIEMTVGMADRISRVLNGRAQAAVRAGDNDLAATLGGLGRAVRTPARAGNPGYREALDNYGAESRLAAASGVGEDLLRRNTDEFAAAAEALSPEERALALATGRRAVERAAGESVSGAPGVARRLSTAPEQQARNEALMGPNAAREFERGVSLEERAVANATDISPRSGSRTNINQQDSAQLAGALQAGIQAARGDFIGLGMDWLRSRGMSNRQARELVEIATDPARTEEALRILEAQLGTAGAEEFVATVTRQAGARNAGEGSVRRGPDGAIEIDINRSTNPEFLARQPR